MWPDVVPVVPVIPALCVCHVVAEQERRGGLEEPHVLLDEVHDDGAPDALVVVPCISALAAEPYRPGIHPARYNTGSAQDGQSQSLRRTFSQLGHLATLNERLNARLLAKIRQRRAVPLAELGYR